MAVQLEQSSKEDDLKTQFLTREGTYRLMNLSEYSRPNRVTGYTSNQSSPQVRVSIVSMPDEAPGHAATSSAKDEGGDTNGHDDLLQVNQISSSTTPSSATGGGGGGGGGLEGGGGSGVANGPGRHLANNHQSGYGGGPCGGDRICFNFGKELFVYPYRGMKKTGPDINKPIDKKLYKGTNPSCHDFNAATATPDSAMLLIGFTTGQIQLVQPGRREPGKLFNEDRLIDKTKVTCLKWLPGSPNLFLAGHSSGHLYLYNEELPCVPTPPHYAPLKLGDGFSVHSSKSKVARNPVQRWTFGTGGTGASATPSDNGSINEFAFSPCGLNLALASQDGFLRVFRYESMELLGIARSYFGGFLCVCWSPDGKYIVVGGEDDLVTIWSLHERRVVARGQGHRSWVSVVAFDPFTTSYGAPGSGGGHLNGVCEETDDPYVSEDDGVSSLYRNATGQRSTDQLNNNNNSNGSNRNGGGGSEEFYSNNSKLSNGGIPSNSRSSGRRRSSCVRPRSVSVSGGGGGGSSTSYRLGSVSQDTQLCLWDITEDLLRQQPVKLLRHSVNSPTPMVGTSTRIEVKPSSSQINNNSHGNSNAGQTPVSSLSSMSSADKVDGTVLPREKPAVVVASSDLKEEEKKNASLVTTTTTISQGSSGAASSSTATTNSTTVSGKQKNRDSGGGGGGISLIGNCVGNNLNKMTMSSSISSTSSTASNQTVGGATTEDASITTGGAASSSSMKAIGNGGGGKSSTDSTSSSSGMLTLNAFTQRLSHFSFGNDKKHSSSTEQHNSSQGSHGKKGFTLSKPFGRGHSSISKSSASGHGSSSANRSESSGEKHNSNNNNSSSSATGGAVGGLGGPGESLGESNRLAVTTFDPMKLIGSPACPRFDECPVLEPLICKKIAHERLTALIFREDCFLTACQDGIIYTWARPPPFEQGNKLPQV